MNILITGGYGFIGSHVVERLSKEKYNITIIDQLSSEHHEGIKKGLKAYHIGVEDKNCEKIFQDTKFDILIHLAYRNLPREEDDDFARMLHMNNIGLSNMLYLAQKYGVKKMITLSPYQVYGPQTHFPIAEDQELAPIDKKGRNFLTREKYCEEYREKGLDVVTLRVGCVYGPRQSHKDRNLINNLITSSYNQQEIVIKGSALQQLDYVYINDVAEAFASTCDNPTKKEVNISSGAGTNQQEVIDLCLKFLPDIKNSIVFQEDRNKTRPDYILDNNRALFELEWSPKYSLEEGIRKTVEWEKTIHYRHKPLKEHKSKKTKRFLVTAHQDLENIIVFLFFAALTYITQYRLNIHVDLFIIYIVIMSIFYGLKQSSVAIALSALAHVWFKLNHEGLKVIDWINDANNILYLTLYFIVGVSVGRSMDKKRTEKEIMLQELQSVKEEMSFTFEMYQKSLEVKNSLQNTIENYEDSFGKTVDIISQLNKVAPEQIFSEAIQVFKKVFKTKSVFIYTIDATHTFFRLAACTGKLTFGKSFQIDSYIFLKEVIKDKKVFINKDFVKEYPTLCAPIYEENEVVAVIFLDDLDFRTLNLNFMNTLKVVSYLISSTLTKASEYEQAIEEKKYYPFTLIMRKNWFDKLLQVKKIYGNDGFRYMVLRVLDDFVSYDLAYKRISSLLREEDYIGELSDGQIGILLPIIEEKDLDSLLHRLLSLGIHVESMDLQEMGGV